MNDIANSAPAGNENRKKIHFTAIPDTLFNDMSAAGLSAEAKDLANYLWRHTEGWRQPWVRLSYRECCLGHGRRKANGGTYDNGTSILDQHTVQRRFEELGVHGFIYELDDGHPLKTKLYGFQEKYDQQYQDEADKHPTTPNFRLVKEEDGKVYYKKDQEPHYYKPCDRSTQFKKAHANRVTPSHKRKEIVRSNHTAAVRGDHMVTVRGDHTIESPLVCDETLPGASAHISNGAADKHGNNQVDNHIKTIDSSAFATLGAKAGAPDVAPTSSFKNVSINDKNEMPPTGPTKEEMISAAEADNQATKHVESLSLLETRASEVAADEYREEPKQSVEQANQEADNALTQPTLARSTYDKQQWTEMIRRQAATLAAKPADTSQNDRENEVLLSDEAQTIIREGTLRPENIRELHRPKKKGRKGEIASYRAFIEIQRQNVTEWQERVRNGSGGWLESRITDGLQTIANYEMAVCALENGLPVDVAQQIAQGRMAMLPEAVQQQVLMYIS